jgi:hypothetical protein
MLKLLIWPINLMTEHDPPNLEINVQYGSSSLGGYQFVNKETLYLLSSFSIYFSS